MNPWLEEHWPGVHTRLIAYLADAIAAKLPEDLNSLPEEGVSISTDGSDGQQNFRADVAVTQPWQEGVTPGWTPADDADLEARAAIPTIVQTAPMTERWIEIREATGRLITVIEILNPGNKSGHGLKSMKSAAITCSTTVGCRICRCPRRIRSGCAGWSMSEGPLL